MASAKWTPGEKRCAACWHLCIKGKPALKDLLFHHVKPETWVDWCRANMTVVRYRVSYGKSKKLDDHPEIPDPEMMDITYMAHILLTPTPTPDPAVSRPLVVDDVRANHIRQVRTIRNELCHEHESMEEETFQEISGKLLNAFAEIVNPIYPKYQDRRAFMTNLEMFADPAAIDGITEGQLQQCRNEISQLREQLKQEKENGNDNGLPTDIYTDSTMVEHVVTGIHAEGDLTTEDIRELGKATAPRNIIHNNVKIQKSSNTGRNYIKK